MIEKKHIEFYFQILKEKGIISDISQFFGYNEDGEKIIIRFRVANRNSSYRVNKSFLLEFLREEKLKRLFE